MSTWQLTGGYKSSMDFLGFDGQKGPIRDFTACSIRCVYPGIVQNYSFIVD